MGNSQPAGHAIPTAQRGVPALHHHLHEEDQWTTAYARSPTLIPPPSYQHKLVVPDPNAHQRLRPTGNGEILQAGGTISGRRQEWQGVSRSSSIPAVRQRHQQQLQQQQYHQPHQRQEFQQFRERSGGGSAHKTRIPHRHNQPRVLTPSYRKDQMKRFGSEPDLRVPSSTGSHTSQEYQGYRGRKKYKAPQPPLTSLSSVEKNDFEECALDAGSPIRRARLFKTRAETKKKISSPVNNRRSLAAPDFSALNKQQKRYKSSDALFETAKNENLQKIEENSPKTVNSRPPMPQMQRTRSSPEFQAELKQVTRKLVSLKRETELQKTINTDNKLKTLDHNINRKDIIRSKLKELKETKEIMSIEERSPASGKESTPEMSPPKVKTFYFGMDGDNKIPNSIGSDMTSESDTETSGHDISLQLRPILPKKQLEIPRFSPSAAWKLLSVDTAIDSTLASEEGSVYLEDRIEKQPRQPPPFRPINPAAVRVPSTHDKSGDSGISGDETPDAPAPAPVSPKQRGMSWTPQQDLGDDSSLDGSNVDLDVKFPTRPHVFSLSLPRDNHLASYITGEKNYPPQVSYTSLQKLKRSVSGVLATLGKPEDDLGEDTGENWFLSRSAPNSLNNGFNSLETRRQYKDDYDGPKQTRRIMYLPQSTPTTPDSVPKPKVLSKSYENISTLSSMATEKPKPQDLQDPPKEEVRKWTKKPKKFTFQSTVRQIERKRLADRLSKEAERKEQQRLRELEAMQRVEEEFQKKRAREKASIRQQLRLYSMDETAWSSLPPNLEINHEVRPEPDGAVSSSTSSPTFKKNSDIERERENKSPGTQGTQVLSEFRQSHREYKEFRSGGRYLGEHAAMVHPRITCNMPKATG